MARHSALGINTNPSFGYIPCDALQETKKRKLENGKRKTKKKKRMPINSKIASFPFFFKKKKSSPSAESNHAHLQRPHAPDPHLELALDALNIVQLDALPPAAPGGFPPEQEQLLRHADGVAAHFVAADVAAQPRQGQAADDGLVGLAGAVAPAIVVVEAAVTHTKLAVFFLSLSRRHSVK